MHASVPSPGQFPWQVLFLCTSPIFLVMPMMPGEMPKGPSEGDMRTPQPPPHSSVVPTSSAHTLYLFFPIHSVHCALGLHRREESDGSSSISPSKRHCAAKCSSPKSPPTVASGAKPRIRPVISPSLFSSLFLWANREDVGPHSLHTSIISPQQ